ncbi:MAG TPA: hypothetical protein VH000_08170 [Rhizomicrobium sp.]|nr:hypothetical protein [Rhizomicrobium sp.]
MTLKSARVSLWPFMSDKTATEIAALLPGLARAPTLYAQRLDLEARRVFFVRMMEMSYRTASFLDDRMLSPRNPGAWIALADVETALDGGTHAKPLHFIFHAGHVGSTLLSRVLDETGQVLSLREPLPLRTLADRFDHDHANADLETFLKLWSRGFASTRAVVLKATSNTARLGHHLLHARPDTRAVYLNLPAETYLATILAGDNTAADLDAHAPEREYRLTQFLGEAPDASSPGERAAFAWLTERLTEEQLKAQFGPRILPLDFETLLANPAAALERVIKQFGLDVPQAWLDGIGGNAVFSRYSKATEHAYSPQLRARVLAEARGHQAIEIRKGMDWLGALAAHHKSVSHVLV